jgi:hypothetical protein
MPVLAGQAGGRLDEARPHPPGGHGPRHLCKAKRLKSERRKDYVRKRKSLRNILSQPQ